MPTELAKVSSQSYDEEPIFSSSEWLSYFRNNKSLHPIAILPDHIEMETCLRKSIIKSLQRFQIGETGDGKHLRKFAASQNDDAYSECIDLFIKEEQSHGRVLAEVIRALDGTLINWHWTDAVFVLFRRILGLKTEIFMLLIAEVIGKCFYKAIADKIEHEQLKEIFSLIVLDEIAHLSFHSQFLSIQFRDSSWSFKTLVNYLWTLLFHSACLAFVLDHKDALQNLGISSAEFTQRCARDFHRSAACIFH